MTARYDGTQPIARRYVRYMIAFAVSVCVGLAPLLGELYVPGFTAILSLFPLNLRRTAIPFAAFIMALPALAIQFYSLNKVGKLSLRRWFASALTATLVFAIAVFVVFMQVVVDVTPQRSGTLRYIIGAEMRPTCPCVRQGLEIQECIGIAISADPVQVESCYSREDVQLRKTVVSLLYFGMMASFGAAIGVLILREGVKSQRIS